MSEFPEVGTPLFYGVFFTAVLLMVAVDMFSLRKNGSHKVSIKEALAYPACLPDGCISSLPAIPCMEPQ